VSIKTKIEWAFGADLTADSVTWTWTDVSLYALRQVRMTFGKSDGAVRAQPASVTFYLNNTDARFTPRYPTSPHYPYVRRQTPVRISINPGTGYVQRFFGYVDEITPVWPSGNASRAEVSVTASGILRRLGQGSAPVRSAMRRSYDYDAVQPVAYWPLEEGTDTSTAYDVINGAPSTVGGFVGLVVSNAGATKFGVGDLGLGSSPVTNISGGWHLDLNLPNSVVATGQVSLQFALAFGTTVRVGAYTGCGIRMSPYTAAKHISVSVFVNDSGLIEVQWLEADSALGLLAGPTTVYSAGSENLFDGMPRMFQLDLAASGGTNVNWRLYENDVQIGSGTITPSFAGAMNAPPYRTGGYSIAEADTMTALGHVAVFTSNITPARYTALNAHRGETATDRLGRLCTEQGAPITFVGSSSTRMGAQTPLTFLGLLRECEEADGGILYDGVSAGLTYLSRASRYNPSVAMALDCRLNQVKVPFQPTEDDQRIRNDWTVTRPGGGSAHSSDAAHIAANGLYDSSASPNVELDRDLNDQASWRVHLGTVEEMRVPGIPLQLIDHPELWSPWLNMSLGERLTIANLPAQYPPGGLDAILSGGTETWDAVSWKLDLNTEPTAPWLVEQLDSDRRLDCGACVTSGTLTTTTTSVATTISDTCTWTIASGAFNILINGELMRVTAVSAAAGAGSSWTQTLTVTRAVNGISRSHAAGSAVHVASPIILAL